MKTILEFWKETKAEIKPTPAQIGELIELVKPFFYMGFAAGSQATIGASKEDVMALYVEYTELMGGVK